MYKINEFISEEYRKTGELTSKLIITPPPLNLVKLNYLEQHPGQTSTAGLTARCSLVIRPGHSELCTCDTWQLNIKTVKRKWWIISK